MPRLPDAWTGENFRPAQLAELLQVSQQWLDALRTYGGGPKFMKLGRSIVYRRQDIQAWLETRTVETTAEADRLPPLPSTTPFHARPGGVPAHLGRPPKAKA